MEDYNTLFSLTELKGSIKKSHNIAVGQDKIYYQLLKYLPETSLQVLLDIMIEIWGNLQNIVRSYNYPYT